LSAFLSARAASYSLRRRPLVDAVSLEVEAGRMTVLIGPNGAGKSTLIRLMSRELRPTSGEVLCEGEDMALLSPGRLALRRAVMTQAIQVSSPFRTHEVVRLGLDGIGRVGASQRARILEQCLVIADALQLASRPYAALSGGEQRRVQFARVLAQIEAARTVHDRQALLLDEPVANLDLTHQLALLDAARDVARRGAAVLAVLHDLNLAARYADTLVLINKGATVTRGLPASVQTSRLRSTVFSIELSVGTAIVAESSLIFPSRWLAGDRSGASRDQGSFSAPYDRRRGASLNVVAGGKTHKCPWSIDKESCARCGGPSLDAAKRWPTPASASRISGWSGPISGGFGKHIRREGRFSRQTLPFLRVNAEGFRSAPARARWRRRRCARPQRVRSGA
jgi:iron complex transport system ATP-binding protein